MSLLNKVNKNDEIYLGGNEYERLITNIVNNPYGLSKEDRKVLENEIDEMKKEAHSLKIRKLNIKTIIHYDNLRKQGKTPEEIMKYVTEDKEMLERFLSFKEYQKDLRIRYFGYPENLNEDTDFIRFLRKKESELYHVNNCGDPNEQGNYLMDSKVFEKEVLKLFFDKFGVDENEGWGYITSGGTESNTWGIRAGFKQFPNAKLYFSEAAHYSVEKAVSNGDEQIFPYKIIEQEGKFSEKIDKEKLLSQIRKDWNNGEGNPAVLVLTWGTTRLGAFDDIKEITDELNKDNISYYLHIDAACHGGIPKHHKEAPVIPSLDELGANSISVSFHKYFGIPTINSVIISKDQAMGKEVCYIGQRDTTISGSRTFPAVSSLQRIKDMLERSPEDSYIKNIQYFEERLKEKNIKYFRSPKSNMFIFPKPSDDICKEFQLATFESPDNTQMAHAIIFPYHRVEDMDRIIERVFVDQKIQRRCFEGERQMGGVKRMSETKSKEVTL